MILLAKELPELRDRLAEWASGPTAPILFVPAIKQSEPDITEQGAEKLASTFAALDAASFRDAELLHVAPTMVELLMQAKEGIGSAGFMDFDLPSPVGMAYFAVELDAPERDTAAFLTDLEQLNPQFVEAGMEPIKASDELRRFAALSLPEHLLCVWRVMAPEPPIYPHGYVHLSWWFERESWWKNQLAMNEVFPDRQVLLPSLPARLVPQFIPDGHQAIGFHSDSAEVRVDFTGGDDGGRQRRPDMFRALCYLLRQRVAQENVVAPDRAARRRMAREGKEPASVRVVSLRGASAHGGGDGSREYVHRWMVRGHWRRQWYPSIQQNRPIWITPYIKGPEDAPLLGGEKVYTVRG